MGWSGLEGNAALFVPVLIGFLSGTISRLLMLEVDYRQYPTYPHGYLSHLGLGAVAALAGAVTLPALLEKEFTAVTFLLLVATQFRDIRKIERDMLMSVEPQQLVGRGADYIEGIARVFEVRNYLVIGVAVVGSAATRWLPWPLAVLISAAAVIMAWRLRRGRKLDEAAAVREGRLHFQGAGLYVDDIYIMNIGLPEQRQEILKWGVGVILEPRTAHGARILSQPGQRQAILHDVTSLYGMRKDVSTPEFTPLARKDQETGTLALYLTPQEHDVEGILQVVRNTPVLEGSRGGSRRKLLPGGAKKREEGEARRGSGR